MAPWRLNSARHGSFSLFDWSWQRVFRVAATPEKLPPPPPPLSPVLYCTVYCSMHYAGATPSAVRRPRLAGRADFVLGEACHAGLLSFGCCPSMEKKVSFSFEIAYCKQRHCDRQDRDPCMRDRGLMWLVFQPNHVSVLALPRVQTPIADFIRHKLHRFKVSLPAQDLRCSRPHGAEKLTSRCGREKLKFVLVQLIQYQMHLQRQSLHRTPVST